MPYATKISLILSSIIKHDNILLLFDVPNRKFVYCNINIKVHIAMTIPKYSYFRKFLFIFSVLFLLSGCDIVDTIFGSGDDNTDLSIQQEQALTTVLTLQEDASDIMENLFPSWLDTLSVIDSLANFFLSDTSIQNVWPDSEGVAVDYNSGISGGIFIRRFIPVEVTGSDFGDLDPFLDDDELGKKLYKQNTVVPINKKSITIL